MQPTEVLKKRATEFFAIKPDEVPYRLDVEQLNAEHREALCALASIILADPTEADNAVTRLLAHAASTPHAAMDQGIRRRLSRQLYLTCTLTNLVSNYFPDLPPWLEQSDGVVDSMALLRDVSEYQRATIALYLYGDHDYRQVAELLGLPAPEVLDLLRMGLEELRFDSSDSLED